MALKSLALLQNKAILQTFMTYEPDLYDIRTVFVGGGGGLQHIDTLPSELLRISFAIQGANERDPNPPDPKTPL